ncbi:MAG: hypothetical protein AB7P02_01995 [Alphaproteobacteria bacterium]
MPRYCCVLASDADYFPIAARCVESLLAAIAALRGAAFEIVFVSLGLAPGQRGWLEAQGVAVADPDPRVPRFAGAPAHAYAQSCRPSLPECFPGRDGYVWIDSDLRFLTPDGLGAYVQPCLAGAAPVTVATENDPAYVVMHRLDAARRWHSERRERLARVHGPAAADLLAATPGVNSGLFAAAAGSPFWPAFRARLAAALRHPYDRLAEQDALNVALFDIGTFGRVPTTMNWLCGWAMPHRRPDGTWTHPDHVHQPIHVLHLTNLGASYVEDGRRRRIADLYRDAGLPV